MARRDFAQRGAFAWYQQCGLDVFLDRLHEGDFQAAERIAWNLYRQAAYVEDVAGSDQGQRDGRA